MEKRLVPVDMIFSQTRNPENTDDEFFIKKWSDTPIVNLDPHMSAARYVINGEGSLRFYREWLNKVIPAYTKGNSGDGCEIDRKIIKDILNKKKILPVIDGLERDRLILKSGHTTCCIAKIMNKSWIEAEMTEDTAESWDKRPIEKLHGIIKKQGYKKYASYPYLSRFSIFNRIIIRQRRKMVYSPILHPAFRTWGFCRVGSNRLDMIRGFLGPVHRKLSLLDIGCNTGYFTFHFARQGFNVTGLDYSDRHLEMARALKETYSLNVDFQQGKLEDFDGDNKFDIVLGMSILYHLLGWGDQPGTPMTPKVLGAKLEKLVGHALIWESGYDPEKEIEVIRSHTGLSHYTKLGITEGSVGTYKEFGVFTRRPVEEVQNFLREIVQG